MLSPRRTAQMGLLAASLMLVATMTVLIAGGSDPALHLTKGSAVSSPAAVTPLATGQLNGTAGSLPADDSQPVASAK